MINNTERIRCWSRATRIIWNSFTNMYSNWQNAPLIKSACGIDFLSLATSYSTRETSVDRYCEMTVTKSAVTCRLNRLRQICLSCDRLTNIHALARARVRCARVHACQTKTIMPGAHSNSHGTWQKGNYPVSTVHCRPAAYCVPLETAFVTSWSHSAFRPIARGGGGGGGGGETRFSSQKRVLRCVANSGMILYLSTVPGSKTASYHPP